MKAIRQAGLVGLGGAGFPTHVKLNPPKDKEIDCLIINGAECEPYITSDYREMVENPSGIINGIRLVLDYLDIPRAVIGIENNKPEAILILTGLAEEAIKGFQFKAFVRGIPRGQRKHCFTRLREGRFLRVNCLRTWGALF